MEDQERDFLSGGLIRLVGSQVFTRLATFGLNQIVTRTLSVEAFGLLSIRFHLINTSILMLSREGFRRGCLISRQAQHSAKATLTLSSWCLPIGIVATVLGCWFFGPDKAEESIHGYQTAILIQGAAAIVELLSEPLYILALVQGKIGLRVAIEATATISKILSTLGLLWAGSCREAIALSLAQVVFAAVTLLGYVWHFLPDFMQWLKVQGTHSLNSSAKTGQEETGVKGSMPSEQDSGLALCCNFSVQAVEKLLLAEGTKIAMTKVQSAYDQGVYGLVVNLGSIAARLLLQPFEEAAFMSFSRSTGEEVDVNKQLKKLMPLLRLAVLFGLVASAFGPSNTYLLLHILYGSKYSSTEAPAALALYCPYILLLAMNGILECFVQAVSRGLELKWGHIALIGITVIQGAATLKLVISYGTTGMILADALGMALRIAFCLAFISLYARRSKLSSRVFFKEAAPSFLTLLSLGGAALCLSASLAKCFGRGWLAGFIGKRALAFKYAALVHIGLNAALLLGCLTILYRQDRSVLSHVRRPKRKDL